MKVQIQIIIQKRSNVIDKYKYTKRNVEHDTLCKFYNSKKNTHKQIKKIQESEFYTTVMHIFCFQASNKTSTDYCYVQWAPGI